MHIKSSIGVGRIGDDEGVVTGEVGGLDREQCSRQDKEELLLQVREERSHAHLVQDQAVRVLCGRVRVMGVTTTSHMTYTYDMPKSTVQVHCALLTY